MNGSINLTDAATQVLIVAGIVSALRPFLARFVPANLMDSALLALNGVLQFVIVFGTLLLNSGAHLTGPAVISALGQAFTIMILTHGGVDAFNRAKKATGKSDATSESAAANATANGLSLDPSEMGA